MTLDYLDLTGREAAQVALVEAYAKAQGLFGAGTDDPLYSDVIQLDLGTVEPSIAGPKRPQDRIPLKHAKSAFQVASVSKPVAAASVARSWVRSTVVPRAAGST